MSTQHHQAIVIGGSLAGLLAARVLAQQFDRVWVVDRDQLPLTPEPRRGVPQSIQPHVLFAKGYRILEDLFPGIGEALAAAGAIRFDWGKDFQYFQRPRSPAANNLSDSPTNLIRSVCNGIVRLRSHTFRNLSTKCAPNVD